MQEFRQETKEKYDKVIVWGAGQALQKWSVILSEVDYIVDRNKKLHNKSFCGCAIYDPNVLKNEEGRLLILINSVKYEKEIRNEISKLQINADVKLLSISGVVYSGIRSYSQYGEDIIIARFLNKLGMMDINYIDIGIPDPIGGSNTFYFYCTGNAGICVEPNPEVIEEIREVRQNDIVVNCGVGSHAEDGTEIKYTRFARNNALNTFSQNLVKQRVAEGFEVKDVINVPIISLDHLIEKYYGEKTPDYISIDAEAYEVNILKDFNFKKYKVKIFCIEKCNGVADIMKKNKYAIAAETPSNFIFMKENLYIDYLVNWHDHATK